MAAVDPADLVDSHEVAEILGLSTNKSVAGYRARYEDFPAPVIEKGPGRCLLWRRQDIEAWNEGRRRTPGRPRRDPTA